VVANIRYTQSQINTAAHIIDSFLIAFNSVQIYKNYSI